MSWRHTDHKGERNQNAKITADIVRAIRAEVSKRHRTHPEGLTQRQIAEKYGVSQMTVSDIQRRHTWAHLD